MDTHQRSVWIDGLRGLAAFYVLLHHAAFEVPAESLHWALAAGTRWLGHGHYAVAVFIVLSGYCLMRPVAGDPEGRLRGGFLGYLGRRALRILPPYYAALSLSLLLVATVPALQFEGNPRWGAPLASLGEGNLLAHLLLLHNLNGGWIYTIDPPMWSIAMEWQIYFLFPVMIAIRRNWGDAALVAFAYAIAFTLRSFMTDFAWGSMCPWYAGLFAFGICAAASQAKPSRRSLPTWAVAVLAILALAMSTDVLILDTVIGVSAASLVIYCASWERRGGRPPFVLKVLNSRFAVTLGAFSYSLYLIHYPTLSFVSNLMITRGVGGNTRLLVMLLAGAPLSILLSYIFYLICERPFTSGNPRTTRDAYDTAAPPAPAAA